MSNHYSYRTFSLFLLYQTRYALKNSRSGSRYQQIVDEIRFMKSYAFSLLAGILAGVVYYTIGVQSPAPPAIALAGLLGMLAGEQILPIARHVLSGLRLKAAWREAKSGQHMFGALPGAQRPNAPDAPTKNPHRS